jgi:hypothetical protein
MAIIVESRFSFPAEVFVSPLADAIISSTVKRSKDAAKKKRFRAIIMHVMHTQRYERGRGSMGEVWGNIIVMHGLFIMLCLFMLYSLWN